MAKSTYDEHIQSLSPHELKAFKKGYRKFLLSELAIAVRDGDSIHTNKLAEAAGISPRNLYKKP
jgi:hypothetical protein